MGNHTVSRDGFGNAHGMNRSGSEQGFNTAMLIAKRYFEMKNFFTPTEKSEMTRLDDAGMYRPHSNLVDAIAFNGEKRVMLYGTMVTLLPACFSTMVKFSSTMVPPLPAKPLLVKMPAIYWRSYWLKPGVMPRNNAEFLVKLPFIDMHGRHILHHGDVLRGRLNNTGRYKQFCPSVTG
jgi:hypothetical protein